VPGAGSVLVGSHAGAVDGDDLPVQLALLIRFPLQRLEHPLPHPLPFPAFQPIVAGALGPIAGGQVFPLGASAQDPQDPVDHLAVIAPLAAALPLGARQQGGDPFPFLIGQVSS
jgi:hypothetical protein